MKKNFVPADGECQRVNNSISGKPIRIELRIGGISTGLLAFSIPPSARVAFILLFTLVTGGRFFFKEMEMKL